MSCPPQLTLTTHLEGGKGLQMYIDGVLVSETLSGGTYIGTCPALIVWLQIIRDFAQIVPPACNLYRV